MAHHARWSALYVPRHAAPVPDARLAVETEHMVEQMAGMCDRMHDTYRPIPDVAPVRPFVAALGPVLKAAW